ncbi:MAG: hypothetical protein ACOYL1_06680 [Chlamydiia bacterium]
MKCALAQNIEGFDLDFLSILESIPLEIVEKTDAKDARPLSLAPFTCQNCSFEYLFCPFFRPCLRICSKKSTRNLCQNSQLFQLKRANERSLLKRPILRGEWSFERGGYGSFTRKIMELNWWVME